MSDLPFEDRANFADADRGLIGSLDPCVVKDASGRVVWDNNDAFSFLAGLKDWMGRTQRGDHVRPALVIGAKLIGDAITGLT